MLGFLVVLLHFFVTQSTCPTGLRLLSSGTGELCPANETLDEVTCEKDAPDFFLNFTNGKIFIDNFRDLPKGMCEVLILEASSPKLTRDSTYFFL